MNEMKIFENATFGQIRAMEKDGEPWFCLADVCKALEIGNPADVKKRLGPKGVDIIDTLTHGGKQAMTFIDEANLYKTIFQSRKPEAERFTDWVASEVIPSIRKHGAYMTPETLEAAIMNPDYLLKVVTALKDETDKRKALEAVNAALTTENAIMAPKAGYFDQLVDRNLLTGIRETAEELGVKEKVFVRFLLDHKYLYRDKKGKLMPYAQYADDLFVLKESYNEKTQWTGTQLLVTPKGRETFRLLVPEAA